MNKINPNVKGVSYLILALLIISIQNVVIKWIGGDYSALEIIAIRSMVVLPGSLMFYRLEGKRGLPKSRKLKLEIFRGL